jgi:hypothetical protein
MVKTCGLRVTHVTFNLLPKMGKGRVRITFTGLFRCKLGGKMLCIFNSLAARIALGLGGIAEHACQPAPVANGVS